MYEISDMCTKIRHMHKNYEKWIEVLYDFYLFWHKHCVVFNHCIHMNKTDLSIAENISINNTQNLLTNWHI